MLPERIVREIHEGLLACDVVGFHTQRWRAGVPRDVPSIGLEPDERRVTAHPISIDPEEFESLARSEPVLARERELLAERPEQLILRVDRTDPSKNVPRGLRGVRACCSSAVPICAAASACSRCSTRPGRRSPSTSRSAAAIEAAAAAVEARFPGRSTLRIADDFPASIAAYKQFDVLLVNAVMDGLNLVAKEAPLVNERDGVVALSVNAVRTRSSATGSSRSIRSTSPRTAAALEQALELGEDERAERAAAISARVREHDLEEWIAAQLGRPRSRE